ncbi:hypothetical protein HNY73_016339 [Argiope bruennichi]|uniref:Uncharacterized protein n=1 Tax=Argiope bruennichi TaxID=94029 RepID=A0A8T0EJQ7_ARGBR|nr:hypothetical protein HNY73_016339 [Argiope bruennichi]
MKIWCQQFYRLQNRNIVLWTKKFLAVLLLWICCCCPGDESHPLSTTSHVQSVTLECHVILEDLYGRYAQLACSCKCWLRCQETQKCLKWYSLIRSVASSISFHSSELSTLKEILKVLEISIRSSYIGFTALPRGTLNVLEDVCSVSHIYRQLQRHEQEVLYIKTSFDPSRRITGLQVVWTDLVCEQYPPMMWKTPFMTWKDHGEGKANLFRAFVLKLPSSRHDIFSSFSGVFVVRFMFLLRAAICFTFQRGRKHAGITREWHTTSVKIPANLSHCGIDWGHSCCLVFCSDNVNHDACSYFKPDSSIHHLSSFNQLQQQHLPTTRHEQTEEVKEKEEKRENVFHQSRQRRQSSGFLPPFRIEILETIKEIAVLQPFNLSIRLVGQ